MKKLHILITSISLLFFSCKKNAVVPDSAVASLSFVNATVGSAPLAANFNNQTIIFSLLASGNKINYGASNLFSPLAGSNTISFMQATDTIHSLFTGTLNLQSGGIYSLYLANTTSAPDTVFMQEQLATHGPTDSVAGIRFINLSPGGNPVSVDIKGQANGSEVASLSYKGRTGFRTYKADYSTPSYIFEFRDATMGTLLATYTLNGVNNASSASLTTSNSVRYRNMTIALIGGGTAAQSAMLVPNY